MYHQFNFRHISEHISLKVHAFLCSFSVPETRYALSIKRYSRHNSDTVQCLLSRTLHSERRNFPMAVQVPNENGEKILDQRSSLF